MSTVKTNNITAVDDNTNLTLTGSGTGQVVIGDGGLILPDTDGTAGQFLKTNGSGTLSFADVSSAGVVQVKGAFTDQYATYSNTNVDNPVDILSVSITPTSASNKILIQALFTGSSTNSSLQYMGMFLLRGATKVGVGDNTAWSAGVGEIHSSDGTTNYSKPNQIIGLYLDSPATTSATTYKLQAFANHFGASLSNSTLVQGGGGYSYGNKETAVGVCQLIVMEVTP